MVRRARRDGLCAAVMSEVSGFSVGLATLVSMFGRFHARVSAAVPGKTERSSQRHIVAIAADHKATRAGSSGGTGASSRRGQ